MLTNTEHSPYAKVSPLTWDSVSWTEGFWKEAFDVCAEETIPHLQKMFEDKNISHVVENFRICAGDAEGEFGGTDFGDGDFYKWMESAMYAASKTKNEKMLKQLDQYIELIGKAQLEDGYISTKQILGERQNNGVHRFGNINDFEVYNFGHLFTAACLYKRLTGKDNFLKIAERAARYLEHMYQENARTGKVQTAVCPSHYMGLIEMYRTTGETWYLELAELAISLRDSVTDGTDDNQDRIPLKKHEKIVGHAVRSNYLYAGVTDLYAEKGDKDYLEVLHKVWKNLMDTKIYITGGCGALYNGASPYGNFFEHQLVHQAYGYEYQLPNVTAYNETCASLGYVFWAYRMFQIEPKAEYFDAIERAMLNVNLAAVSLDGKKYFYENMLRRAKELKYELIWPLTRSEYILSYCCPPNLARTLAESSEYAYVKSEDALWTGMYGASKAKVELSCGAEFTVEQKTGYPYDGKIVFEISNRKNNQNFNLKLRIPGWVQSGQIYTPEGKVILTEKEAGTYVQVPVTKPGDVTIVLDLDMPVRYTVANTMVEETVGQAAVERGPLVYCVETEDTEVETLDDLMLDLNAKFITRDFEVQGRKMTALETEFYSLDRNGFDRNKLYQPLSYHGMKHKKVRMIPYFAWDNRSYGEMRIWIPIAYR